MFNVTEEGLQTLVAAALSKGGDYSDLYFEHTTYFNLNLKDGVVSSGGFHTDYGVGIRVLKGEKTGYAYSENLEMSEMLKAAKAASAIAQAGGRSLNYCATEDRKLDLYNMQSNWREVETSVFLPFLLALESKVKSRDSRIIKVLARLSNSVCDVMMYNSLGELTCETRPMGSLSVTAIFMQNNATENKNVSRSFRMGASIHAMPPTTP